MSSLFASRAYYAFGFLALTAGVVALTTGTVTILFTYFILCAEEYRFVWLLASSIVPDQVFSWQWRAFMTGGGSAFWIFLYGLFYWASRLSLDSFTSVVLYFGYLLLICLFDFLVTGASFCVSHYPSATHCCQERLGSLHLTGSCVNCTERSVSTSLIDVTLSCTY